jgi:hypothetical protein
VRCWRLVPPQPPPRQWAQSLHILVKR